MNIFYLHSNPQICAEMHCDKHVVKMIIEYAQLLSTAHRVLDGEQYLDKTANNRNIKRWLLSEQEMENNLYKASHVNHPSNIWVRQSVQNYIWLQNLWYFLCQEYTHRYGKSHLTYTKLKRLLVEIPKNIPNKPFTDPTPAMPDYCKLPDSLQSYRNYYINEKRGFAKWTKREAPEWYQKKL